MKKKPTLAVLFGGNSPEYSVSLQSAYAVLTNLDGEKYHILPLGITQTGRWYLYSGAYEHIATDTWAEALDHLTPVAVSPDPAVHGLLALFPHENRVIPWTAPCPFSTGPTARTEPSRASASWQASPWPAAAPWPPPCAWTRTGPTSWPSWPGGGRPPLPGAPGLGRTPSGPRTSPSRRGIPCSSSR